MTDHNPDGWTFATLYRHFTALREDDQRAVAAALEAVKEGNVASMASSEKAIAKAEDAQQRKNEASNEIRGAMVDQQKNFASVDKVDAITERLGKLETNQAAIGGKSQGVALVVLGIATVASLLIGAASLLK